MFHFILLFLTWFRKHTAQRYDKNPNRQLRCTVHGARCTVQGVSSKFNSLIIVSLPLVKLVETTPAHTSGDFEQAAAACNATTVDAFF
jgi:hypothetical protein